MHYAREENISAEDRLCIEDLFVTGQVRNLWREMSSQHDSEKILTALPLDDIAASISLQMRNQPYTAVFLGAGDGTTELQLTSLLRRDSTL